MCMVSIGDMRRRNRGDAVLDEVEVLCAMLEHPDNVTDKGNWMGDDGRLAGVIFDGKKSVRSNEENGQNKGCND